MKRKISLLPFLFAGLVLFGLNLFVLSGIHTMASGPEVTPLFWSAIILIVGGFVIAIARARENGMGSLFKIAAHAFLILIVAELLSSVLLLAGDIYSWLAGEARSLHWVQICVGAFALTIVIFLYGMIRGKYAYRVIHHTLYFDNLPAAFDGFQIAQISDVHAGSFQNAKAVQKGIDLIKKQHADLFVFTGDLVNNKAEEIKPWISYFSQIKAPFGQFSILGNHDYGDYVKWENAREKELNLEQLKTYHAQLGYRLLLDEHVRLKKDGQEIVLAGVENWGIGFGERGDLKKALSGTSNQEFKILLSHDPSHWEAEVLHSPSAVNLTLSGHTHGMQFGIEAFGLKWSPVKYRYAHWAGVKGERGRYININRGFGFLGFSGRIGIWPEVTLIELKTRTK